MKESKAIKKLAKGKIQIYNDNQNTVKLIELLKLSFPEDNFPYEVDLRGFFTGKSDIAYFVKQSKTKWWGQYKPLDYIKTVNLSSITPNTPTKKEAIADLQKRVERLEVNQIEVKETLNFDLPKTTDEPVKEKTVLEVGKWYKTEFDLLLFSGKDFSLGFHNEEWGSWSFSKESNQKFAISATKEEVETALTNERIKRGIVEGDYIESMTGSKYNGIIVSFYFKYDNSIWAKLNNGQKVYVFESSQGQWNTTKKQPIEQNKEEVIDWSKKQLLQVSGNVYFYNGVHDKDYCEVMFFDRKNEEFPTFPNNLKSIFKPFKGEITIKNESPK